MLPLVHTRHKLQQPPPPLCFVVKVLVVSYVVLPLCFFSINHDRALVCSKAMKIERKNRRVAAMLSGSDVEWRQWTLWWRQFAFLLMMHGSPQVVDVRISTTLSSLLRRASLASIMTITRTRLLNASTKLSLSKTRSRDKMIGEFRRIWKKKRCI